MAMFGNPFNFGQYPGLYGGGFGGGFFQPSFGLLGQMAQNGGIATQAPNTPNAGFPAMPNKTPFGGMNTMPFPFNPMAGGIYNVGGAMFPGATAATQPGVTPPPSGATPGMAPTPKVGTQGLPPGFTGGPGDIYRAEIQGNPLVNGQQMFSNAQISGAGPSSNGNNPVLNRFANMAPGQLMQNMMRFATPQDYLRHFGFNQNAAAAQPGTWQGLLNQVR